MITSLRSGRRTLPLAVAGLGLFTALAGCAERVDGEAAAASSSPSESAEPSASEEPSTNDELAAGLLPAEAFGPDAEVLTVDVRQLSSSGSGGLPPGGSVAPPECGQSVGATTVTPEDFAAIVAQTATTPTGITVQVLAESDEVTDQTQQLDDLLAQCPRVTVNAPDGSTVTVDFTALEVPDLGDVSEGVAFSTAVAAPDGTNITVPSLLAVATDGQRMLFLQQTGTGAEPLDQAAFTALFEEAFTTQQEA